VRRVALISASSCRSTRSSLAFGTLSSACSIARTWLAAAASSRSSGWKRRRNSRTSMPAIRGCAASVVFAFFSIAVSPFSRTNITIASFVSRQPV